MRANESRLNPTINVLNCNATDHADEIKAASATRGDLKAQDKLLVTRMRKYRLFPTAKQRQQLIRYMETWSWTYNQAVAHFQATNVSKAATLRDLYVTQVSNKQLVYPEGMEPPPQWALKRQRAFRSIRCASMRASVKSAFSNLFTGNIKKFKEGSASFTIHLEADGYSDPLRSGPRITNEIQITNTNGFWYAVIPQACCPNEYSYHSKVIALDPGVKAFMTGVNQNGNVLHGTSVRAAVASVRESQECIPATAKLKNAVKELHYQTAAYLTETYDVIILSVFSSNAMVKRSTCTARNHTFNRLLLGLKHFQFRQLLKAKCELMGESLVICSEMYTSQTCGPNSEAKMPFIAPIVITWRGEMSTLPSTFSDLPALNHYRRINNERNSLNTTGYSVEAAEPT